MTIKKSICFFILCFYLLIFMTPTGFALETEIDSRIVSSSSFQPGSGGMLCQDENGREYFISPEEILSYSSDNSTVALPSLTDTRAIKPATLSEYPSVVMVESYYQGVSKPSRGSGAFIGPTGILTCAHALYSTKLGAWATETYVYTDYIDENNYEKNYKVKNKYIGGEYKDTDLDDWGIITVTEASQSGYYGYKSTSNVRDLIGMNVTVAGYCQQGSSDSLYFAKSTGMISNVEINERSLPGIYIFAKGKSGMSGAPALKDSYVYGIATTAGTLSYEDGTEKDIIGMLVINPWLYNAISEHSGR